MEFELSPVERTSVAAATQLVRDAGWPEKADVLDRLLTGGQIVATTDPMSIFVLGQANKERIAIGALGLDPVPMTAPGRPDQPLTRGDSALVRLAGVLLHEADHIMCHGEVEAYGEMISFGEAVLRLLDRLFAGQTDAEKRRIRDEATRVRDHGTSGRNRHVDREPPDPPAPPPAPRPPGRSRVWRSELVLPDGRVFRLVAPELADQTFPPPARSALEQQMDRVAVAVWRVFQLTGGYPRGGNAAMVKAIREVDPEAVREEQCDGKGQLLDPWGRPYLYRAPGKRHPRAFDLTSTGPCGDEEIVCALERV